MKNKRIKQIGIRSVLMTSVAAMSMTFVLTTVETNVGASASNSAFATLSGHLPFTSASLEVEALTSSGAVPILNESGASASYSVTIPDTPAVAGYASANNGILNTVVLATSGTKFTSDAVPVSVGSLTAVPSAAVEDLTAPLQPTSTIDSASASPDICVNLTPTYQNNVMSKIGEMHVANQSGISAVYTYQQTADSTFTVGLSINGGAFQVDGSSTVGNSIGTGGTNPGGQGYLHFIDDDMNYIKQPNSCGETLTWATSSNGDVPTGPGTPGTNPWGTCHNAPYYGELNPAAGGHDGTFIKSVGTSQNYSLVATVFTFGFGGSTGYTTTDSIEWYNASGTASWVCGGGSGGLSASPIIYNSPS